MSDLSEEGRVSVPDPGKNSPWTSSFQMEEEDDWSLFDTNLTKSDTSAGNDLIVTGGRDVDLGGGVSGYSGGDGFLQDFYLSAAGVLYSDELNPGFNLSDSFMGGGSLNGTAIMDSGIFFNRTHPTQQPSLPPDMQFGPGHLISVVAYSCLLALSAMGNLTVLVVILRRRRRSSPFTRIDFMLLHLSIADLIVTFFTMPLEIAWNATVYWRGGDVLCRVMAFFRTFGLYLSGFVLVCLALDRYLAVKHPMQMLGSGRRGKIMMSWAWFISVVCSLPQAYIFHVERHPDFPWYTQCVTFNVLTANFELVYNIFCVLMMYALPFAIILLLYCGIVLEIYKRTTESKKSNIVGNDGLRRSGLGNLGKAREKTLKMTVAIVAMFFICWSPYNVMTLWYIIDKSSFKNVDHRIQKAFFIFAVSNSTVNPILYGIFHLKSTFTTTTRSSYYSRDSMYRSTLTSPPEELINGHRRCASTRPGRVLVTATSANSTRSFYNPRTTPSIKYSEANGASSHQKGLVTVSWNPNNNSSFC